MMLQSERAARKMDVVDVADLVAMLHLSADWLARDEEDLTRLDQAIGDGDHGRNMRIGFSAVLEELDTVQAREPDLGTLLSYVGLTLISAVGGASGPLYGACFASAGMALSGRTSAEPAELVAALEAACQGIARRGHCTLGDKTILDTLQPATDALRTAVADGATLADAFDQMSGAARRGMISTIPLQARCGLAMRYGPHSIGHQDPGATSCYLLLAALATAWKQQHA